jgi:hypothetical protein
MRGQILLVCLLLSCMPCLGQSDQDNDAMAPESPVQAVRMELPPPISGVAYATNVGAESRSNFLRAGITVSGGYVWNLDPSTGLADINEATYLVQPALALDRTTGRFHSTLTYNPAFAWYQMPSVVRTTSHGLTADLQWHLAPYVNLRVSENFLKTSTAFDQILPSFQSSVGGSTQLLSPGIVGLYEPQMSTATSASMTWQYGRNNMVSGSGWMNTVEYTDSSRAGGFNNTNARGAAGSWTHRLGLRHYVGGIYQYTTTRAEPVVSTQIGTSQTQMNSVLGFCTVFLTAHFSLSLQGGGEHTSIIEQPFFPDYRAWKPAGTASLGWQGDHSSFAVGYGRVVTAGSGLLDAYTTNTVDASGRWQLTPSWTVELNGHYSSISNLVPDTWANAIRRGHSGSGTAALERRLSPNLTLSGSYSRVNQSWRNVGGAPFSANPNGDRVLVSLSYTFSRPIGR